ncbi:MAG: hypothetical protein FWD47_05380 [Treponema sp.]|nr:hypothetical protein [Treponema sp.]
MKNIFTIITFLLFFGTCVNNELKSDNFNYQIQFRNNENRRQSNYYEESKVFWFYNPTNIDHLSRTLDIENLIISYSQDILNLNFLKEIPQLTDLKKLTIISKYNIENMEALRFLHNLEELHISGSRSTMVDISPIFYLDSLKYLELSELYHINDISLISNLNNLKRITISNCNNIRDINPIFDLIGLEWLQILLNEEKDLTNITNLQQLELLNIRINRQDNIDSVSNLNNLKSLIIQFDIIHDVTPLLNLKYLEEIIFLGDKVDVIPLATSKSLKQIVVMFSTYEKYQEYIKNGGDIFEKNGIQFYYRVPH